MPAFSAPRPDPAPPQAPPGFIYFKLLLVAFFWGGTFIAGRLAAQHVAPFSAAFLRFLIASAALLAVVWRRGGRLPRLTRGLLLPVALLGLSGVFAYNVCFFEGLRRIEAGRAALIIANNPIGIALGAALFFRERLSALQTAGILLSIGGALTVISRGRPEMILSGGIGAGELLILGCVASWVTFSLVGKLVMRLLSPLEATLYAALVGTAALLPFALAEGLPAAWPGYTFRDWICLAYLGLFGTVAGFVWYYQGIRQIGAAKAGVFINFVPVSALLLGWLMLGEALTPALITGGALVLAGVVLTNRRRAG
jgi:drug/metabolite transporter (DMT)-like permease